MITIGKIILAAAVELMVVAAPGSAGADPTPPPQPGYQIPGPDGRHPGPFQTYPPVSGLHASVWLPLPRDADLATPEWRPVKRLLMEPS